MLDWIAQYWLQVLFAGVCGAVTLLWKQVQATRIGLRALLRNSIINSYNKWIEREYIPIYAMESTTLAYQAYHQLGGNGTVTKLYNELLELPTHPPEGQEHESNPKEECGNSCLRTCQNRDKTSS